MILVFKGAKKGARGKRALASPVPYGSLPDILAPELGSIGNWKIRAWLPQSLSWHPPNFTWPLKKWWLEDYFPVGKAVKPPGSTHNGCRFRSMKFLKNHILLQNPRQFSCSLESKGATSSWWRASHMFFVIPRWVKGGHEPFPASWNRIICAVWSLSTSRSSRVFSDQMIKSPSANLPGSCQQINGFHDMEQPHPIIF